MLQAITDEPGQMRVRETTTPSPGPGQALVRVEAVGLCGSDFHLFLGDHPYARFPQTQGHEFSGIVKRFGPGYTGPVRVGDRVAVEPVIACGACFACRRGRYNCCRDLKVMGAHVTGALAEQVVVRTTALHPVGDLEAETGALVEPISIGLQAVLRATSTHGPYGEGDTVVVLGAGPIGLAAVLAAADRGARVLAADRIAHRLDLARELGADRGVDTTVDDLADVVQEWTGRDGAAVVIDATGVPTLIRTAIDLVAPSGTVVVVGISPHEVSIPVSDFSRKELNVLGSRNSAGIFDQAVDLVRRHARKANRLITHRFGLEQVPEAIDFAMSHPQEAEKVMITMNRPR